MDRGITPNRVVVTILSNMVIIAAALHLTTPHGSLLAQHWAQMHWACELPIVVVGPSYAIRLLGTAFTTVVMQHYSTLVGGTRPLLL